MNKKLFIFLAMSILINVLLIINTYHSLQRVDSICNTNNSKYFLFLNNYKNGIVQIGNNENNILHDYPNFIYYLSLQSDFLSCQGHSIMNGKMKEFAELLLEFNEGHKNMEDLLLVSNIIDKILLKENNLSNLLLNEDINSKEYYRELAIQIEKSNTELKALK